MIELEKVNFGYSKRTPLIKDFSLELQSGTVCGLLGKNGAGKSTLLYLICGLLKAGSGKIDVNGYTPFDRSVGFLSEIFIVPEEFSLPSLTLEEYVGVNSRFYPNFKREDMDKYLEMFDLEASQKLSKMSMGQKKKAFITFALACNTRILILDEPTNGLDISAKRAFRCAVATAMNDEKIILISTHQVYDVEKILDHVVIMDRKGVLLNAGIPSIQEKLSFIFTPDRQRASEAVFSMEVPGGYSIVERNGNADNETEVNLESLFELAESGYDFNL